MQTNIVKWGNSLALRVPAAMARDLDINEGAQVELIVENGNLVMSPLRPKPVFNLDALLDGISNDNLHGEISFGPAVGNEW